MSADVDDSRPSILQLCDELAEALRLAAAVYLAVNGLRDHSDRRLVEGAVELVNMHRGRLEAVHEMANELHEQSKAAA